MRNPRFSVVIPTFNRGYSVSDAVNSVLSQSVPADEIIVIDDGSTDHTSDILAGFGKEIILIRQPNRGVSAARNAGIDCARGDWIAFLDSDDVWRPDRIAILNHDVSGSDAGVHVSNLEITGPGFNRELFDLRGFPSGPWPLRHEDGFDLTILDPYLTGIAARRDWINSVGGFDVTIPFCEDVDLLCKMIFLGPWLANPTVLAELRRIGTSNDALSFRILRERVAAESIKIKIYKRLLISLPQNSDRRSLVSRMLSKCWFNTARELDMKGHTLQAKANLVRSAREHPTLKGWLRALPPLLLGKQGYRLVERFKPIGFYRDATHPEFTPTHS